MSKTVIEKVSVHGGHSGQFCLHARDTLEQVVLAYIDQGFSWVGITEHMPPFDDAFRYQDEADAGISAEKLQTQFKDYFEEVRRLKAKYADSITLYTCFETEMYDGALPFIRSLIASCQPDYVVGSVHHVSGICIDYSEALFGRAMTKVGGLEPLYCQYFDAQFELLQALEPAVVGHFDLIRKYDENFLQTLALTSVAKRIERNLGFIADKGLILDFNLRGQTNTGSPYPCLPVLEKAAAMDIAIVPGDDSHGVASVAKHWDQGIALMQSLGISTSWKKPC